ncbi:TfoX/Sxy family DNA transformation protein [Oceanicola sp. S124]|uniref:TfoX/Sxy family DNA transformation protein n=1 Tax=Oceanicola sp. S124 TaxID=1042378 RepID=UPI0002559F2C|nr:TfoX/Sxy family DNA transformation protein [Oceanicola sp. S124]
MTEIRSIPNLGPAMQTAFERAGIASAEELREMGCDAAYLAALKAGMIAHFAAYMSVRLGLQGRPWTDAAPAEKAEMRQRYEGLRAAARDVAPPDELTRFLDRIGLPPTT